MSTNGDLERIGAHVCDDVVTFQFEDGSTRNSPADVVLSSCLLRIALCRQSDSANVSLQLPRGLLNDWLRYIATEDAHLLHSLVVCSLLHPMPAAVALRHLCTHLILLISIRNVCESSCCVCESRGSGGFSVV